MLVSLILWILPLPAEGVGVGAFDISRPESADNNQPSDASLHLKLKNGQSYKGSLYLTNLSDKPTSLFLYAADALPARNGGVALRGRQDKKIGLAKWIKFPESEVKLNPHERRIISYTIKIPAVTPPDEYMGGIVAESAAPIKNKGSHQFAISVLQRAALIVTQRLPGPAIQKLLFLSFTKSWIKEKLKFDLVLKNAGNIHLDPQAKIIVTDIFGNRVDYLKVPNLGTVFPGKTSNLSVMWPNPPIIGIFTANARVSYGNGKIIEQSLRFLIFPWWLLIVLIVAVILIAI